MQPSELKERLLAGLLDFAWDEWGQMGLLASPRRTSPWAQDPEALIAFTLEVARHDPRLFDGVMDWLQVNESLLSVRRLRAMCQDAIDSRLLDAALGWLSTQRPRARLSPKGGHADQPPERLFRGLDVPVRGPDQAFLEAGFLRTALSPAGKAKSPALRAPINLAFRLRLFLGVGVRAEVVRHLVTAGHAVTVDSLMASAAFARRNVNEGVAALERAGVVLPGDVGGPPAYTVDFDAWRTLLGLEPTAVPIHRDWRQLLGAMRAVLRWLEPVADDLPEPLLASLARDLLDDTADDLRRSGVPATRTPGPSGWSDLEALVDLGLDALTNPGDRGELVGGVAASQAYMDARGSCRWRIWGSDGGVAAISAGAFRTLPDARRAFTRFADAVGELAFESYVDDAGLYRWRATAPNGEVVAAAGEAFTAKALADEAAANVRRIVATTAIGP